VCHKYLDLDAADGVIIAQLGKSLHVRTPSEK
jgi:hypothetical protein